MHRRAHDLRYRCAHERVLEAHKRQPRLEKRFEQLKTVHEIAAVFLKNPARIEAPLHRLLPRAPHPAAHRARTPTDDEARAAESIAAISRGASLRSPDHRAGAAAVQPRRAPPAQPRRPRCAELRRRFHSAAAPEYCSSSACRRAASAADGPAEIPRNHFRDVRKVSHVFR